MKIHSFRLLGNIGISLDPSFKRLQRYRDIGICVILWSLYGGSGDVGIDGLGYPF